MILSVSEKRTESLRNRTSAVWDCPHVAGIHTLRTSFEPCHCQFHANNSDSWRIRLNIETYPLLLLSPSFLPIFLSRCHPLPTPPRGLDIITKIFKDRVWECIPCSIVATNRVAQWTDFCAIPAKNERTRGCETGFTSRSSFSVGVASSCNLDAGALWGFLKKYLEHLHRYIIPMADPSPGSWSYNHDKHSEAYMFALKNVNDIITNETDRWFVYSLHTHMTKFLSKI